jgi:predicted O-methyltransferase YrrM
VSGVPNGSRNIIAPLLRGPARSMRRILPGLARRVGSGAELLRRSLRKLEIRLAGFDRGVLVKPIADIPAPRVELESSDPIAAIMAAAEFTPATAFFADNPVISRSLETPAAHALLYCLIRNLRPDHVFEIGTYQAGTTEAICRALHANGRGMAHSVDPYNAEYAAAVLKHWPPELLRHIQIYSMDSMAFYMDMRRKRIRPGLVFVDGEHDYEFALFDIGCAACAVTPGGFIFIDNVDQAGPFLAARDFLSINPGWRELGSSLGDYNPEKAFDAQRKIANTDFIALRAPRTYYVDGRPRVFSLIRWWRNSVSGVRLQALSPRRPGKLTVQVVFRGFGGKEPFETFAEATTELQPGTENQPASIAFAPPAQLPDGCVYYTVEPWLIWHGEEPLQLLAPPEPY